MRIIFAVLIAINALVVGPLPGQGITAEELVRATTAWNGSVLPAYPEGQPEVTILKITIPPQSRLPWHKHPVINAGYVLQGELQVTAVDGRVMRLKQGDALIELVNEWHYGENLGEEPVVILVFYAGAVDHAVTVLKEDGSD